jgi:hypothetical protein
MNKPSRTRTFARVGTTLAIAAFGFAIALLTPTPAKAFVAFSFGFPLGFPAYPPPPPYYYPPPPPPGYYPPPGTSGPPGAYPPAAGQPPGYSLRPVYPVLRRSPIRRGGRGPTPPAGNVANTRRPERSTGARPSSMGQPAATLTANGGLSTDSGPVRVVSLGAPRCLARNDSGT